MGVKIYSGQQCAFAGMTKEKPCRARRPVQAAASGAPEPASTGRDGGCGLRAGCISPPQKRHLAPVWRIPSQSACAFGVVALQCRTSG